MPPSAANDSETRLDSRANFTNDRIEKAGVSCMRAGGKC